MSETFPGQEAMPESRPPHRLVRSRTDRMIGGVAGGLATHLGIDPLIVRLTLVIGALATAVVPVMVGYLVACWVMPEEKSLFGDPLPALERDRSGRAAMVVGAVLIALGMLYVARTLVGSTFLWPAVLVVAGIALLASGARR